MHVGLSNQRQLLTVLAAAGMLLFAILAFVNLTWAVAMLLPALGVLVGLSSKRGIFFALILVLGINSATVSSLMNSMAVGMLQVGIALFAIGGAIPQLFGPRDSNRNATVFRVGVVLLLILTLVTSIGHEAFAARSSPSSYVFIWISILVSALAISFWKGISWLAFCIFQAAIGVASYFLFESLLEAGANEIWIARTVALAAIAVLTIPSVPLPIRILLGSVLTFATFDLEKDGPIVALVIGGLVGVVNFLSHRYKTWRVLLIGGLTLILVGIALITPWGSILEHISADGNVESREVLLQSAFSHFLNSPWIGQFVTSPADLTFYSYPHNAFAELSLSWGLLGILIWIGAMSMASVSAFRTNTAGLLASAIAFSLFSGDFASNPEYWLLGAAAVATMLQIHKIPATDEKVEDETLQQTRN